MTEINKLRYTALVVAGILLLSACAGGGTTTQAPEPETTEAPEMATDQPVATEAPEPEKGGVLAWGDPTEPETFDHACTFSSIADNQFKTVYDSLVFWGPDQEFYPYLAESWEVSDDFTEFTFHLREGVTFHDGTPFNAQAVKFNFDRLVEAECATGSIAARRLNDETYTGTEVIDDHTVRVTFSESNPVFLKNASNLYFSSPTALEELGEDYGRSPSGTGAFMLDEWVPQDHLTVVRNPDYEWGPTFSDHTGPAYLEEITWHVLPEETTRLASLEAGEMQIISRVEVEMYNELKGNPEIVNKLRSEIGMPTGWLLNVTLPPTDDIRVRRAIGMALDRETALSTLFGDVYQPAYWPLSPATFGHWPGAEEHFQYDPERAVDLLEEAGWTDSDGDGFLDKDGERLTLLLTDLPNRPDRTAVWEFFQAQLREVGIDLVIEFVEAGVVVAECGGANRHICPLRGRMIDPWGLSNYFDSSQIGVGFNWTHHEDEEIDRLLDAGVAEADPERREEIYQELQMEIMQDAIYFPIWTKQVVTSARQELQDWHVLPAPEYIWLYDAYIEE